MPSTRMGTAAVVREAFAKAAEYRAKLSLKAGKDGKKPDPPEHDPRSEALLPVLEGKLPVMVRAHRADDIETALRLAKELSFPMVLLGGAEAWKLAPRLAAAKVPVVYSPPFAQPDGMDRLQAVEDAPARLHAAGVTLALASGDAHNARNLPVFTGRAVAFGLPWDAALAAITSVPARILGIGDRAGTVEPGRQALLVLWSGDPLEASSLPRKIVIGESVLQPDSVLERNQIPWRKP
jgi:imidazolonepropionase-like amidohydrolase